MRYGLTGALVAGILFGLHDAPAKAAEGGHRRLFAGIACE